MNKKYIVAIIIVVLIVGAGSFYGGTVYEKKSLTTQGLLRSADKTDLGANGSNARNGNGYNGPQRQGGGMAQGRNGGPVSGQITAKDDKSITIRDRDGSAKIVYFSDSTQVDKTTNISVSDLSDGQEVLISGKSNPDGSITAQNIQIRPVDPPTE